MHRASQSVLNKRRADREVVDAVAVEVAEPRHRGAELAAGERGVAVTT